MQTLKATAFLPSFEKGALLRCTKMLLPLMRVVQFQQPHCPRINPLLYRAFAAHHLCCPSDFIPCQMLLLTNDVWLDGASLWVVGQVERALQWSFHADYFLLCQFLQHTYIHQPKCCSTTKFGEFGYKYHSGGIICVLWYISFIKLHRYASGLWQSVHFAAPPPPPRSRLTQPTARRAATSEGFFSTPSPHPTPPTPSLRKHGLA